MLNELVILYNWSSVSIIHRTTSICIAMLVSDLCHLEVPS
jgi:hypothetical protein